MNRPPPLGRIFALYFRGLFLVGIAGLAGALLALWVQWPLVSRLKEIIHEPVAAPIPPTPATR
jgi:hypothetical protein